MLNTLRISVFGVVIAVLSGCSTEFVDRYFPPPVRPEEIAEIKVAIRKITRSPVVSWMRGSEPGGHGEVYVTTEDHKSYSAVKWRGKWYFHEVVIMASSPHLTMRWSERLAVSGPRFR
jgi:hypothetical protein